MSELEDAPFHLPDDVVARMSPEELERYHQQQQFSKEHAGHEEQHEMMLLILLFSLFAFQFIIIIWKQKHPKSFKTVSLAGLWIIPVIFGLTKGWWRFLAFWTLFSVANGYVIYLASRKPIDAKTPRLVYQWYAVVYRLSFFVGAAGYTIMMLTLFGITPLLVEAENAMNFAILLLSYGLYFGVLGRDFVDLCSDRMASTIGYYSKDGFPRKHLHANICAVCGQSTGAGNGSLADTDSTQPSLEPVHQLGCQHSFHERCIRGWCLIGKKEVCPYCKEKVDMKQFQKNPWDTQQHLYLNLLDGVRYLVVWQPILFAVVQGAYYILGLD